MKRFTCILLAVCMLLVCMPLAIADESDILGKWYLSTYECSTYPDVVFSAYDADQYIQIYSDGTEMIAVTYNEYHITDNNNMNACKLNEDGTLQIGIKPFKIEDGNLVLDLSQYGAKYTYTRNIPETKMKTDAKRISYSSVAAYDGTYELVRYGMEYTFVEASDMNLSGTATIDQGSMLINWTRDGVEKSSEISFDDELNSGHLYTVVNDSASYNFSPIGDDLFILNIGFSQVQWVFRKTAE